MFLNSTAYIFQNVKVAADINSNFQRGKTAAQRAQRIWPRAHTTGGGSQI